LVTTWDVHVTGIEFIDDFPMEANGKNLTNTAPDHQWYASIPEDFKGWGRGAPLTGWDWEGKNNFERAACYRREKPVHMRVRLNSSLPAPTARTFTLKVTPAVDGKTDLLKPASVTVNWPAGSIEQIVPLIATDGALPNEVSRYHVKLVWSVSGLVPGGVINRSEHKIFSIYEKPLDPVVSNASGTTQAPIIGLTKQRLDQLMLVIGGGNRRFPTPSHADVDRLIWHLCEKVNDSGPPHFDGRRAENVTYGYGGPVIDLVDQWVMWLAARTWHRPDEKAWWNVGACISYAQLMKTMLAAAGINSRRAWVIPKTTLMPDGSTVSLTADDLVAFDDLNLSAKEQRFNLNVAGIPTVAAVKLINDPNPDGSPSYENFEACLYYGGKLVPGAIGTHRYPRSVLHDKVGFADAKEVMRWWHGVSHGNFKRFMAWVSQTPPGFFDKDGNFYSSPYNIPPAKRLPVP